MRAGYSVKRIKDICDKGSSNVAQKDLEGHDGKYPIYGASGFIKNVDFYHQEKESIGLVKDGSIGKVFILPPKSSVIGTMQYIFPKEGYSLRFVAYCLQSLDFKKFKAGAVIPHIYFRDYGESKVLVAESIKEQQRIVDILDQEFAKIDALKANAEKSANGAKDLFLSVLEGVFSNKAYPLSSVSSLSKITSGFAFKSSDFVPYGDYQVIRLGNVKQNNLRLDASPVFINRPDDKVISKSKLEIGDLLITQTGTKHKMDYGFVAMVDADNLLLNQRVARLRFPDLILAKWFLYYSYTQQYKSQFFAHEGGTVGQGNVGISALTGMMLPIPDNRTIAEKVKELDGLFDSSNIIQQNYQKTLTLCDDLKQALLRKAFNGEL